jgi:hypothetical protein
MTDRKKPGVAFWAMVLAVVIGLYPLSLGPAAALVETGLLSAASWESMFAPMLNVDERFESLEWCVRSYVSMCAPSGEIQAGMCARYSARHTVCR